MYLSELKKYFAVFLRAQKPHIPVFIQLLFQKPSHRLCSLFLLSLVQILTPSGFARMRFYPEQWDHIFPGHPSIRLSLRQILRLSEPGFGPTTH